MLGIGLAGVGDAAGASVESLLMRGVAALLGSGDDKGVCADRDARSASLPAVPDSCVVRGNQISGAADCNAATCH